MGRPRRIHAEGGIYHAMTRGDGGRRLFADEADYAAFMELLARAKQRFRFDMYAYCLMPTHLHLLLRVSAISVSVIMHWLQLMYAKKFNRIRGRWGHVFQDRFKAPRCRDDRHLLALLRYIHRNPVRGGLVESAGQWPWSGHQGLVGARLDPLVDKGFPLSMFSSEDEEAMRLYDELVRETPGEDSDEAPLSAYLSPSRPKALSREHRPQEEDWRKAADEEASIAGISTADLLGDDRGRNMAQARHAFIRRMVIGGWKPTRVADLLGCSPALISQVCRRF
jgi:REP element-mobilizing transposase RayT